MFYPFKGPGILGIPIGLQRKAADRLFGLVLNWRIPNHGLYLREMTYHYWSLLVKGMARSRKCFGFEMM